MNEDDQFAWLAHEATAGLNLTEAQEADWADFFKRLAASQGLSYAELRSEIEKCIPEELLEAEGEDSDEADWWRK